MKLTPILHLALVVATAAPLWAQESTPSPAFDAADIHASPHRSYPFYYVVALPQGRYVARDATLLNLIATAYETNQENVQGGPGWLALDRFDIIAKEATGTSKATLNLMLRDLLEQRFQVKTSTAMRPMPAYVLRADKAHLKIRPATGDEPSSCKNTRPDRGVVAPVVLTCRNTTMDELAGRLRQEAADYVNKQVVNATGLEGAWDFELRWTYKDDLEKSGSDANSLFAAMEKQMGLKLALETAPRPVLVVDRATEQPTPNLSNIEAVMPPLPVPQFEVATIKPSKPGTRGGGNIAFGKVDFRSITLKDLIDLAWDLNEEDPEVIVNAPKWLGEDRYDILAKTGPESTGISLGGDGGGLPMDIYEIQLMLQALLIERFHIKAHKEDRLVNAYTLVAANPRLKLADPSVRTACVEGPGQDGKDPRLTSPAQNRLVSCRNMSMPQICEELRNVANGYIFNPVQDGTGLKGSFDFTLNFSSADRLLNFPPPISNSDAPPAPAAPSSTLSLFEAVSRQLGLKLEKQKRSLPVLVIDHIEEKPTEN